MQFAANNEGPFLAVVQDRTTKQGEARLSEPSPALDFVITVKRRFAALAEPTRAASSIVALCRSLVPTVAFVQNVGKVQCGRLWNLVISRWLLPRSFEKSLDAIIRCVTRIICSLHSKYSATQHEFTLRTGRSLVPPGQSCRQLLGELGTG